MQASRLSHSSSDLMTTNACSRCSTLEYKVKQRHLLRENKKRPATSASATTAASSNNSSASSPPDASGAHPLQDADGEEPEEKKFCRDSSFESLVVNDL